jgi:hypothetical protein
MTKQILSANDIKPFISDYLYNGRKLESWEIKEITIKNSELEAIFDMNSIYKSGSDQNQFHLTIYTALEVASQLMIIYAHKWANRIEKSQEGWMVESKTRSRNAIRASKNILVKMSVKKIKEYQNKGFCIASFIFSDNQGGVFEVDLKGFLS